MHVSSKYYCFPNHDPALDTESDIEHEHRVVHKSMLKQKEELKHQRGNPWWVWLLWLLLFAFIIWLVISLFKKSETNKGNFVVALAGNRSNLPGGLTKARAIVGSIQAYQTGKGAHWINLPVNLSTIDLLAPSPQVISNSMEPVGQYDKIRINISKINLEDSQGAKTVYMPGHNVEFPIRPAEVKRGPGNAATAVLSSISLVDSVRDAIDESGKNVKVFAPVVAYEILDGAQVDKKGNLDLASAQVRGRGNVAMDINGNTRDANGIPRDANLRIEKGKVVISGGPLPPTPPLPPGPNPDPRSYTNVIPSMVRNTTRPPNVPADINANNANNTNNANNQPSQAQSQPGLNAFLTDDNANVLQFRCLPATFNGVHNRR